MKAELLTLTRIPKKYLTFKNYFEIIHVGILQ